MSSSHLELGVDQSITAKRPSTKAKNKVQPKIMAYRFMIFYRFLLALIGGYVLASLSAMLIAQGFNEYRSSAAMSATMLGFCIHTAAFIWVFMVNKTLKASLGIFIPTLLLYLIYHFMGQ